MSEVPELFHIGKNIRRIREIRGIKQEVLANELGISHQAVSKMEQSAQIDEDKLQEVARILGVSPEVIKNFNEDVAINNFSNTYENSNVTMVNYQFNPIEKFLEVLEENKQLYERMLETERSKVKLLEALLKEKGK